MTNRQSALGQFSVDANRAIERNNLMYVGISRAKGRLNVYCGTDASKIPTPLSDPSIFTPSRGSANTVAAALLSNRVPFAAPAAIKFSVFDGFMPCSLQYHYAHELNLPAEQELVVSIWARRSVLAGLEYVYHDGAAPQDAFLQAWNEKPLRSHAEVKMLYEDAWMAFSRGIMVRTGIAQYVPQSTAIVNR